MVSHGDAWQVTVLLTFDRCAISGVRPSRTRVLRCQLQLLRVLWSVVVIAGIDRFVLGRILSEIQAQVKLLVRFRPELLLCTEKGQLVGYKPVSIADYAEAPHTKCSCE